MVAARQYTVGWQHVAFSIGPQECAFSRRGGFTFDTRLDRCWRAMRCNEPVGIERRFLALVRPSAKRASREWASVFWDRPCWLSAGSAGADGVPPYLKSILGGLPEPDGYALMGDTLVASSIELRVPLSAPLSVGKVGVSAFVDVGKAYQKGQRFADQRFERGIGGAVWFSAAFLRLNVAVAHGIGGSTRVQIGTSVSGSGQASNP